MKKRLILGIVGFSLASGFLVFGKAPKEKFNNENLEICATDCCDEGPEDSEPSCCPPGEMCYE